MNAPLAELGLAGTLAVAVAVSGLWLIRIEHDARQRFVELEELNREQDRLQIDWGRLQLEQSTWATHSRIEGLARERLNLGAPKTEQIVVVSETDDEHGGDLARDEDAVDFARSSIATEAAARGRMDGAIHGRE
jgi:cell division protein FtsL